MRTMRVLMAALSIAIGAPGRTTTAQAPAAPAAPAQGRGGRGQAAQTPQGQAPIDLTGWWVSIVTEDWRWRMVTPAKGDYASVPINSEGRRVADTWDPAKDEKEGNACKAYGVGGLMRVPGRLHITWQDENNLKIETDAGTQTRLLHFGPSTLREPQGRPEPGRGTTSSGPSRAESRDGDVPAPAGERGWQGYSVATWEIAGAGGRGGGGGGGGAAGGAAPAGPRYGSLKVVTKNMKAGYLRKNGVPYSENAVVTEYFDRHNEPNGDQWFTVTTTVEETKYLNLPFITSTDFKKEADGAKWRPTPCAAQ